MTNIDPTFEEDLIERTLEDIRNALKSGRVLDAVIALKRLRPADLADAFSELTDGDQARILPNLEIPVAADLLAELEDDEAAGIAQNMSTELLADVLDEMEPDDAADVLGDLDPRQAALALAEMEESDGVIPLLAHPDETAGGLMTTSFIALSPQTTTSQAIEFLRQVEPDEETPYYLNVTDQAGKLVGLVGLRELVLAPSAALIGSIMNPEVVKVRTDVDQEEAARMLARYDLAALPVVDENDILKGVITYDDVVDVLEEEATEDIYRLANVADADLSIDSPIGLSVRRRLPWLFLSTLTALFAAWVISNFEHLFAQVALLAVFQSIVSGMGGNAATQSLAIAVRALALREISFREARRTLLKEAFTGILQGISIGAAVGLAAYLWKGNLALAAILGLSLLANMVVAVLLGTLVPLVLRALRLDPALAASVLVTAGTDSVGFAIFLGLSAIFIQYLR